MMKKNKSAKSAPQQPKPQARPKVELTEAQLEALAGGGLTMN